MKARALAIVGIRLIGLMTVVGAIQTGPTMFGLMLFAGNVDQDSTSLSLLSLLPGLLWILALVALGVTLIAYAPGIGSRLFPEETEISSAIGASELQVVLFSAVGALLLVEAGPAVLRDVVAFVAMARQGLLPVGGGIRGDSWLQLGEAVLRAGLGVYLLLGARGLAAGLRRLRRAGT